MDIYLPPRSRYPSVALVTSVAPHSPLEPSRAPRSSSVALELLTVVEHRALCLSLLFLSLRAQNSSSSCEGCEVVCEGHLLFKVLES